ncbi:hypothetical protein ANN_24632 [Periplaneta americana]|uniref:Uncharacterized protein n=1 Tax=Periplaneta americana TaxID=6978 RepID=A0ABQ8S3R6_PERAM|nr:hypothetical protein ANN_24632 [Periplaneta americana]
MSDETHFELSGSVNKRNMRYWRAQNSRELHMKPLHSQKVTVWCGMFSGVRTVGALPAGLSSLAAAVVRNFSIQLLCCDPELFHVLER